jgi:hypothetical protein
MRNVGMTTVAKARILVVGAVIALAWSAALSGAAAAGGGPYEVSQGFQRASLGGNDSVTVTPGVLHSLFAAQDFQLDGSTGYSRSRLSYDEVGRTLTRRCEWEEGIAADGDLVVVLCSRSIAPWQAWSNALLLFRVSGSTQSRPIAIQGSRGMTPNSATVAVSGRLVVAAWTDGRTGDVVLRRSTDGGVTFKPVITLGRATMLGGRYEGRQRNGRVQVAIDGSNVYVAWHPGSVKTSKGLRPKGIRIRRSTDGGKTFKRATNPITAVQRPGAPSAVATDTGVLVLHTTNDGRVRLLRSVDHGRSFRSAALTGASGSTGEIDLAAAGMQVRAVWRTGTRVLLRRSGDGGSAWAPPEDTGADRRVESTMEPNVVLFGEKTAVAWSDADPVWDSYGPSWVSAILLP